MDPVRFVYFNGMNLAMKYNLPVAFSESTWQNHFSDIMHSMQETFRYFLTLGVITINSSCSAEDAPHEITVQTASSRWIIGKRFPITNRVYFILVDELFSDVERIESKLLLFLNVKKLTNCR
jgi:hypothetical protein